jgi:ATP-dependent 26S proteasome regulatory subunit
MKIEKEILVKGIPKYIPEQIAEDCRDRLIGAVRDLLFRSGMKSIQITAGTDLDLEKPTSPSDREQGKAQGSGDDLSIEERAEQYHSRKPLFDFDFLVVPDDVMETLLSAVDLVIVEDVVFDKWNLRSIEPFPRAALNFHGNPGTGKTLAAHAVASYLKKPILTASYAQIESKYVGDGSKNVESVFYAAQRDNAILFIDEADPLLSRRLTDVTQGAEQAINSMRSQLLICLENYKGIVIFSTNLVENYDRAFETRMRHVMFPMPDEDSRRRIWKRHLPKELPQTDDVKAEDLAKIDDICGRDIKNAVIDAALRAARSGRDSIDCAALMSAIERVKSARIKKRSDSQESD